MEFPAGAREIAARGSEVEEDAAGAAIPFVAFAVTLCRRTPPCRPRSDGRWFRDALLDAVVRGARFDTADRPA